MSTIRNIKINNFVFEQGDSTVLMDCEINKGARKEQTQYQISQTDLNQIMNKLVLHGINPMDFCESYSIGNGGQIYEINLAKIDSDKRSLQNISFYNPALKIQA